MPIPLTTCLLRLGIAAVLGMLIGIERDLQGRAAGIRTHLLVCTGAALFTLISVLIGYTVTEGRHIGDPARIAAQVATGIGFLGAGTILKSGLTVRGLTTAAYLWLVAAIGVACAIGQVSLAVIAAIVTDFLVVGIKWVERFLPRKHTLKIIISTECYTLLEDVENALHAIKLINIDNVSRKAERKNQETDVMTYKSRIEITVRLVRKPITIGKNRSWQKYFITQDAIVNAISKRLNALKPDLISFAILNGGK